MARGESDPAAKTQVVSSSSFFFSFFSSSSSGPLIKTHGIDEPRGKNEKKTKSKKAIFLGSSNRSGKYVVVSLPLLSKGKSVFFKVDAGERKRKEEEGIRSAFAVALPKGGGGGGGG